jgi:hypothetical protein
MDRLNIHFGAGRFDCEKVKKNYSILQTVYIQSAIKSFFRDFKSGMHWRILVLQAAAI